jgi:hypothetical protein
MAMKLLNYLKRKKDSEIAKIKLKKNLDQNIRLNPPQLIPYRKA